ncbi:class I SAM-dependent DNA methyltransferase [Phaeobacter porticola]|uniref:Methyltransferase-like protein n=1 Tax=Phaeobacter porticola TaxID=1844006 RepID=A0A1L3I9F6_9RHOB|nr:class I SAM-dependent methyltransferase [Phaeobacter porticola]APG48675.1 methyltransferase-like protein [Phaeobacter porticola]
MAQKPINLTAAYGLESPEQSRQLYADWADSYDRSFAEEANYILPEQVARMFAAADGQGPVLDIGAGTGLCGVALDRLGISPIDATDISPEMLAQALRKDVYRDVIEADLSVGVPVPRATYDGLVSSGTFTHGHVGPEVLPGLLRIAKPAAVFALAVNARFSVTSGFTAALNRLQDGNWIRGLTLPEVAIYGPKATGPHQADKALIAVFSKV